MHGYALEWLAEHLQPGRKVLDVGCGSGYLTACFASMVRGEGGEQRTQPHRLFANVLDGGR